MEIKKAQGRRADPGSPDWFTGQVQVEPLHAAPAPARVACAKVTFQPGARTNWHTHPLGQTLIVTEGRGWVQSEGAPRRDIAPGDVVWFEPGERHWHGATAREAMTHIAVQEAKDGSPVDWAEPVSDADYGA